MPVPLISVCIPSYNHARYLPLALESILAQTCQDFEIILVDDGSTDDSFEIAKSYQCQFPEKIQVFTHPEGKNQGISASCNLAVQNSQGEYLAWLGSDDIWYPDKLKIQVDIIEKNPKAQLVYGLADIIDTNGNLTGDHVGSDISSDPVAMLICGNYIPALTVIHSKKCHEKLGFYDESLLYSDWDMWIKIASHYPISFIAQSLGQYRIHESNVFAGRDVRQQLRNNYQVLNTIKNEIELIGGQLSLPDNRFWLELRLASLVSNLENRALLSTHLDTAARINPGFFSNIPELLEKLELYGLDISCYPEIRQYIPGYPTKFHRLFDSEYLAKKANSEARENLKQAGRDAFLALTRNPARIKDRSLTGILGRSLMGEKLYNLLKKFLFTKSLAPTGLINPE